jgi:phytoene desaturase
LSGADYHHETFLIKEHRAYLENIGTVGFAPSSLLFYVGFNKKMKIFRIMHCFLMIFLPTCQGYL